MNETEQLREIKKRKGYTLQEMADSMGVAMLTVFRWINGRFKPSRMAMPIVREYIEREK